MRSIDAGMELSTIREFLSSNKNSMIFDKRSNVVKNRYSDCLVYVVGGECEYKFSDGLHLCVKAGDILYLPYLSCYEMRTGEVAYSVLYFNFFFEVTKVRKGAIYTPSPATDMEGLFRRLYKTYRSQDPLSIYECMSLAYKILASALRSSRNEYIEKSTFARISAVKEYIDRGYSDPLLSVSELAKNAGMSEVYFRRLFRSIVGVSPSEYITSVRILRALDLFKSDFPGLSECASAVGFSTVQYFTRVFKKKTGLTPAKYKKTLTR